MTDHQWTVIEYCTEEVRRQGHDIYALDGIQRVGWMLEAWSIAMNWQPVRGEILRLSRVERLGSAVERIKNRGGFRTVGVRVGTRVCPPAASIEESLWQLLDKQAQVSPLEFYKEFELIHPFVDGNGRTGKILLNLLSGTLLNPIFPPNDLFGEPILNP